MNRRGVLPLVALSAFAAVGIAVAAAADRAPESAVPPTGFGAGPVHEGDPRTDDWADVADMTPGLSSGSANACERGVAECLAVVVREMRERLTDQGCDHTAPFAFTYLEMTRGVLDAVLDPGFFSSPPATVHADALFARLYFDAFDNWDAGRVEDVPAVWRVAFGAAETDETNAATDLLLGMNAHISRDLPYVVADIAAWQEEAEVGADPGTGSTDFDKINDVIGAVKSPMLRGAADRFDPDLIDLDQPLPALATADSVELIGVWRNQALERGTRLARATTDDERRAVEGEIEREALAISALLLNAGTTVPGPISSPERDAYCESRRS